MVRCIYFDVVTVKMLTLYFQYRGIFLDKAPGQSPSSGQIPSSREQSWCRIGSPPPVTFIIIIVFIIILLTRPASDSQQGNILPLLYLFVCLLSCLLPWQLYGRTVTTDVINYVQSRRTVALESLHSVRQVAAPCNVCTGRGLLCVVIARSRFS